MSRLLLLLVMLSPLPYVSVWGQETSFRSKTIWAAQDTVMLDTLTIYPNSLRLHCGSTELATGSYQIDPRSGKLILFEHCSDSLFVSYRVLPMNLYQHVQSRDTSVIYKEFKGNFEDYLVTTTIEMEDVFGGSSLRKSGSISRGISFGNNQDLGVNSTLNLELAGDITPNLKLLASVTDDNLPIQPDGNTNKLQEFDQVYIQVYNEQLKLNAGDFWLKKPKGYFLNYNKRAQGLTAEYQWKKDSLRSWYTQFSGAFSKGKFNRQIIQGVEGNQGPYRLVGAENESFILVLAGTESVFIDGKQLQRGQEYDYVINYNTAELIFTSRNQITKDSRIVVEFQYSDQNYARTLAQSSIAYSGVKLDYWMNIYNEQDAKNQTIQQDLNTQQKILLASIGDTLDLARTSSIDSTGYFDNQVLYRLTDSLGYDSVLVFSVDPNKAFYRATFQFVGTGNGDYTFKEFNATGKVYQWVAPVAGIPQGDYAPSRLIITPKKRQMITAGLNYKFNPKLQLETELAYSQFDQNTFSRFDAKDDNSFAGRSRLKGIIPLSSDSLPKWNLHTLIEVETLDKNFSPIQQYRAVEFDRDWNTRAKNYVGNQLATKLGGNFVHRNYGFLNLEAQQFLIGSDYNGYRAASNGNWKQKGFSATWDGSYLNSEGDRKSEFVRHRAHLSQNIGWFKFGYKDDHELNLYRTTTSAFDPSSYQFFDYQFYIANSDSIKNYYSFFYRERYDQRLDTSRLQAAAKARTSGFEVKFTEWKNQSLSVITSYRELRILNEQLIQQTPENTLLGRFEYDLRLWKSALSWNTFYEAGSGLEQKREFLYIKVNDGQGVYTWIDYNGDGVKDINEFEIAQFVDQASYIRVFTPSNDYVKTYSNEFNQSIFWRPERVWSKEKGVKKILSRFSDQARVRINRKTTSDNKLSAFNPFVGEIRDSTLIATHYNLKNTLYFNRTSNIFGADYSVQQLKSKSLLATGFDSRENNYHEMKARWNIIRVFTLEQEVQIGERVSAVDFTSGRNYALQYYYLKPSFSYQPGTSFRLTLEGKYTEKHNHLDLGGEEAFLGELGLKCKYNQAEKGSLQAAFRTVHITYNGAESSALSFEMLESLKVGTNYTWELGYQRLLSKNLQLSIQYNGRKSENSKYIHSAGMEVRAYF